jgi:hypothetical protein
MDILRRPFLMKLTLWFTYIQNEQYRVSQKFAGYVGSLLLSARQSWVEEISNFCKEEHGNTGLYK